jgi:hypothetical protein
VGDNALGPLPTRLIESIVFKVISHAEEEGDEALSVGEDQLPLCQATNKILTLRIGNLVEDLNDISSSGIGKFGVRWRVNVSGSVDDT